MINKISVTGNISKIIKNGVVSILLARHEEIQKVLTNMDSLVFRSLVITQSLQVLKAVHICLFSI
ncbi:hypothetical protein C7H19_15125 [Aphanothece hegewaldii CCALA 016]|uniref:Uncharacterized protein n=1 Tax=Aphanothece hegewaldii CCALA 016 TaxID=2107694 RepID=A0A2T1LVK0_9CHRO|nr:hypothetical protein C7H19_15125 [Aphanothece hegewaldii CCALA 016]